MLNLEMPRLVWLVLHDGRSVVAGCGGATRDALASAIAEPATVLTFSSDDCVEHIAGSSIRDFVMFDARTAIPPATSIYRLLHL
jgi:hypothetical protein